MSQKRVSHDIDSRSGLYEQFDYEEDGVASTGSYATILKIDVTRCSYGTIVVRNDGGTNTLNFKILGSLSPTIPSADTDDSYVSLYSTEDAGESTVAINSSVVKSYSDQWKWILVEVKNGNGSTTAKAWHRGVN